MKIRLDGQDFVDFSTLMGGDVFIYDNNVWIKWEYTVQGKWDVYSQQCNACRLDNGRITVFNSDVKVTKIHNAVLTKG